MLEHVFQWASSLSPAELSTLMALMVMTVALVRASFSVGMFALIAWPGTVSHEAAHALVGLLLGAKPTSVSLFPKHMGNGHWQLGSVGFARLRWWNAPWTAMAPMLLAPMSIWLAVNWVAPLWEAGNTFGALWRLLLCSVILHASWPSRTDFRLAIPGLIVLACATYVLM